MNKGYKHSLEARAKMSVAHLGYKQIPEHIEKRAAARRGMKHSPEAIAKMSRAAQGRIISLETRAKMGAAQRGKKLSPEHAAKLRAAHLGAKRTPEARAKMSAVMAAVVARGENSHLWRGGVTPLRRLIRGSFKYRQWRSDIFTRDDFTCILCGKRGGDIEADHYPTSFSAIFLTNKIKSIEQALACEEFWNINNGRTLCLSCHKNLHWGRGCKILAS